MDIKKHIKKINSLGLLAIGFVVGLVVMYLYLQPKLTYQEKTVRDLANLANKNQQNADLYEKNWLNTLSKLDPNPLLITPTPTYSTIDPHAGMKEVKTMNCQPDGGNGATNCTEYDYWYNPNTIHQPEPYTPSTPAPTIASIQ